MKTEYITKSLVIKHPPLEEAITISTWLNDPEVVKYSEQRHTEHATEFQETFMYMRGDSYFGIYLNEVIIGTINFYQDKYNKIVDVGIMIGDKTQWGKGYGYEAWECVCDDLLSNGIRKIEAGCMFLNKPMLGIFRKYNMIFEGTRREHFLINGKTTNMVLYGKFAP